MNFVNDIPIEGIICFLVGILILSLFIHLFRESLKREIPENMKKLVLQNKKIEILYNNMRYDNDFFKYHNRSMYIYAGIKHSDLNDILLLNCDNKYLRDSNINFHTDLHNLPAINKMVIRVDPFIENISCLLHDIYEKNDKMINSTVLVK